MNPQQQSSPDEQLQGGVGLAIFAIFSVTRSVQLFSRLPGTTGPWFFGVFFWIGLFIQLWYYQANVQASGRFDAIPDMLIIYLQFAWLVVHWGWRKWTWLKGYRLHSYEPGLGVLHRVLPTWPAEWMGLASDIFVAAALGGICYLANCPILGSWYLAMIPWLLIAQAVIQGRDYMRMQRMDDARIESDEWTRRLREQHHWAEMQRERWGDRHH